MMTSSRKVFAVLCTLGLATALQAQPAPAPAASAAAPAAENSTSPKIQFATPIYDFGKARSGEPVKYTYYFTNTGDAVLELSNVQPQCGCTTAGEFSRKVEPGQTGMIPISFNTSAYNGQVFKTVTVTSNDKKQSPYVLQLKGVVWKAIETIPQYAVLNVPPDSQNASITIEITNHMEEPLDLFGLQVSNPATTAELNTNTPGKSFQVVLKTVPPVTQNNISGHISLKTSSTNTPTLDVPFWVNVQPAITMLPPQVYLPQAPLAAPSTNIVNVQNNSTNAVTLSDPSVNVPGVDVHILEVNPGHTFSVILKFPSGFEVTPGQQAMCTVKSSHAQFPLIKLPIMQAPRPAMPPLPNVQGKPVALPPAQIVSPAPAVR